jgi:hypothetical protein
MAKKMPCRNPEFDKPCYVVHWKSRSSVEADCTASSVREMAKVMGRKKGACSCIYQNAVRGDRGQALYSIFRNEDEYKEFLKTGKQYALAVKHIPTGNVWESTKAAAEWLGIPETSMNFYAKGGSDFERCQEFPVIKDPELRYIRKQGQPPVFVWTGVSEADQLASYYKHQGDGFERVEVNSMAKLRKEPYLIVGHFAGESVKILSMDADGSAHPYKVRFRNGDIGYLSHDEFERV